MKVFLQAALLLLLASTAQAQLLLPTPELRVEKDCEVCPEMVILPDGLYMSRAPVMVSEFRAFVEDTGYRNTGWGCKWNYPDFEQGPRHPVTCVTFEGAQVYARWLSDKTGRDYRIPTGEELDYAIRAATTTNYWWWPASRAGSRNVPWMWPGTGRNRNYTHRHLRGKSI